MTKKQYARLEAMMQSHMQAAVHDVGHVYRVLWAALRLAREEKQINYDVLIISCLLHDIGRAAEDRENRVGHAKLGAQMARELLPAEGWDKKTVAHVCDCIETHSFKRGIEPKTLEAKILFDADKLDLTGAVGTARALLFGAEIKEPLYQVGPDGLPTKGKKGEAPSLLREYNRKLKMMEKFFYTKKARKIARKRQLTMDHWFDALKREINNGYKKGNKLLKNHLS